MTLTAPTHEFRTRTFGSFSYTPAPRPGCPEAVRIDPAWVRDQLVEVHIPQLAPLGVRHSLTVHYRAVPALQRLWVAWEASGAIPLLRTFDGLWNARYVRQTGTEAERAERCRHLSAEHLSNHAYATAFDVNAAELPLGLEIPIDHPYRQLVHAAESEGWFCGGNYVHRKDWQHWELAAL